MSMKRTPDSSGIDQEIERDVAELRSLLQGVEGPSEPHPAYWQNFVVHVRRRIDDRRVRRRRWDVISRTVSVGAVAVLAIVIARGVLDDQEQVDRPAQRTAVVQQGADGTSRELLPADPLVAEPDAHVVLSKDDVRMLNALMSDDEDAIFDAMVASNDL